MKKFKKGILNLSVLLYFIFLILTNQVEHYAIFIGFYSSLILCGVVGLYAKGFRLTIKSALIILLLIVTAGLNLFFVGNTTFKQIIYIGLFGFASLALICDELSEKTLLIAFAANAIVILYKLGTVGPLSDHLFTNSSRNFVSVYLMYPLVIYYSIIAKKNKDIHLYPVFIAWLICLLARGRGGIITSTILLLGICFVKYRNIKKNLKKFVSLVILIVICLIIINLPQLLKRIESFSFMEMFARNQMDSSRFRFWPEYIDLINSNVKNFLLGANISKTYFGRYLEGNPHNSFIEIHMLNGIIGLTIIVITLIKNCIQSIKNKNLLFVVCLFSLLLRAFTDHVLWAAFGTPVLFYFLFYTTAKPKHKTTKGVF